MGWKMVYNFLGKDEKHGEIFTYFRLKHHCGKEVGHFSNTVYPNKNHVTTHPGFCYHPFLVDGMRAD